MAHHILLKDMSQFVTNHKFQFVIGQTYHSFATKEDNGSTVSSYSQSIYTFKLVCYIYLRYFLNTQRFIATLKNIIEMRIIRLANHLFCGLYVLNLLFAIFVSEQLKRFTYQSI